MKKSPTKKQNRLFFGRYRIRTLDLTCAEWFDRQNGNFYFSARVVINYGLRGTSTIFLPFQYGYGSFYEEAALRAISNKIEDKEIISRSSLWRICHDYGIILRSRKIENCKKTEVKAWGSE